MRIGELAAAAGAEIETIRFYERKGLLAPPPRLENGYRAYDASHLERLIFIRHCRSLDIGLDNVRVFSELLDNPGGQCNQADALVDEQLTRVRLRIASLQKLKRQLNALRSRCNAPSTSSRCGILGELVQRVRSS